MQTRAIWLALGANAPGTWGEPRATFDMALSVLEQHGVHIGARYPSIVTPPLGFVRQTSFLNTVVGVVTSLPPAALLRLAKRIERLAGRRLGVRWGPRPLDIDLLSHGGRGIGPKRRRAPGRLTLPHPELHRRGFVLVPLAGLAPHWWHPDLKLTARSLLLRQPRLAHGICPAGHPADRS